ncbi:MAG: methyltransferase, FxLD system [Pseudonocardiaceae bacterium]
MSTFRDTNVSAADEAARVNALREAMVRELCEPGWIRSDRVAEAFRAVPRHLFAPGTPLETAYATHDSVVTKSDEQGKVTSVVSAPYIQAMMVEQAGISPGMRVLEIGSGGYNAALLAELVGQTGQVTTVDIDPEVVNRARSCLATAGYHKVNLVLADAEGGVPDHAPYDRVIVTVGAWDIPPAWIAQLAEGGRAVLPLRMRGLTRSVAFKRDGDRLVSRGYHLCGFVPMQGAGAHTERLISLDGDEITLRVDETLQVDADRLRDALRAPRVQRWSGVELGGVEPIDDLDLWLATVVDGFGLLTADKAAIDSGRLPAAAHVGAKTILTGGTFAYRCPARPVDPDRTRFELGVYAHGPQAEALAEQYVELIRTWDRDHRGGPGARIKVYPAATPDVDLPPGRVVSKKHTRVVISWLAPRTP